MCQEIQRVCNKCKTDKPINEYAWRNQVQGIKKRICKACENARAKIIGKEWYKANKARKREQNKRWEEANYEKQRAWHRNYRKNNRKQIQEKNNLWRRKEREKNPYYRASDTLRRRVNSACRRGPTKKSMSSLKLIGATTNEVIRYLETLFREGMTWENFGYGQGKWQIDHIVPVGSFDLSDPEQQKRCFHYTNLQPLWYNDHKEKTRKDLSLIRESKAVKNN